MKGRKPIPTVIKQLKGTARKSRTKEEPKKTAILQLPMPPQEWEKAERDRYFKVCAMLQTNKLLDAVNMEMVYTYVIEMKNYFEAVEKVKKMGAVIMNDAGDLKVNPWRRVQDMSFKNIMAVAREFGFTPSAASRIAVSKEATEIEDEFSDV